MLYYDYKYLNMLILFASVLCENWLDAKKNFPEIQLKKLIKSIFRIVIPEEWNSKKGSDCHQILFIVS